MASVWNGLLGPFHPRLIPRRANEQHITATITPPVAAVREVNAGLVITSRAHFLVNRPEHRRYHTPGEMTTFASVVSTIPPSANGFYFTLCVEERNVGITPSLQTRKCLSRVAARQRSGPYDFAVAFIALYDFVLLFLEWVAIRTTLCGIQRGSGRNLYGPVRR